MITAPLMTELLPLAQVKRERRESNEPLEFWTDGAVCVSCWRMSFRERIRSFLSGRVWVTVMAAEQSNLTVSVQKRYFRELKAEG